MSVDRRLLNWGIFLLLVGGVPLAVGQGWVPRDVVERAWELWPLILIGAGIGLILSRTPFRPLGGVVVAATCGLILGAIVAVGFGGFSLGGFGCGGAAADAPGILAQQGTVAGDTGRVVLDANCASLSVRTGAGRAWSLDVRGSEDARPTVDTATDGVTVRSPSTKIGLPGEAHRATWQVLLGTDARLDLDLHLNAGDATLDLAGARLSRLAFAANAIGDTRVDLSSATVDNLQATLNAASASFLLPAAASLAGTIEANAASVELCAPAGVGLRLTVDSNITAGNNYGSQGLTRSGDTWETAGYATSASHVELRTTGSAVSFTLNPKDGCR